MRECVEVWGNYKNGCFFALFFHKKYFLDKILKIDIRLMEGFVMAAEELDQTKEIELLGERWTEFYSKLTGERLGALTSAEASEEEIENTIGLLAYDHKIKETDIEVKRR